MSNIFNIVNKYKNVGIFTIVKIIFNKITNKIERKFYNLKQAKIIKEWKSYYCNYLILKKIYKKYIVNSKKRKGTGRKNKIIWWCWLQGEKNIPKLQKICLNSVKENFKDWKIIIITLDNYKKYISIPDYIERKYKNGLINNAHFSDLLRLELLIKYGGVWIDSTVYCTGKDEKILNQNFFVYKNLNSIWYGSGKKFEQVPIIADNWFISSEIENPILIMVRDLLYDYWKKYDYALDYFIFHLFFTLVVNYKYKDEFDSIIDIPHTVPHLLQYNWNRKYESNKYNCICQMTCFHKLNNKFNYYEINEETFGNKIMNIEEKDK